MATRRAIGTQLSLPVVNGPAIARAYVERNGFVSRIERLEQRDGQTVGELMMACDLAILPDVPGHWIELFDYASIDNHIQRARAASAAKLARGVRTWLPGQGAIAHPSPQPCQEDVGALRCDAIPPRLGLDQGADPRSGGSSVRVVRAGARQLRRGH